MTQAGKQPDRSRPMRGDNAVDQSFRTFLVELEAQGELIRFKKSVHPTQNMSAVEWKTYAELGKSSLFTNIEGHPGVVGQPIEHGGCHLGGGLSAISAENGSSPARASDAARHVSSSSTLSPPASVTPWLQRRPIG
jgi:hypothetical protein